MKGFIKMLNVTQKNVMSDTQHGMGWNCVIVHEMSQHHVTWQTGKDVSRLNMTFRPEK